VPEKSIKFSSLFEPGQVLCGLEDIGRDEAVRRLVDLVAATGDLADPEKVYRLVLEREKLGATVLAPGIVVPHARIEGLSRLHVAVATSREGLPFGGIGRPPARLLVLILTPAEDPGGYLQAQAALAHACHSEPDIVEKLAALENPAAVWQVFDRSGERLPDYVSAAHMMNRDVSTLRANDPLRKAIDEFRRLGVSELPVVDADGDLVGVVSEDELLRVCLPEYITWMEDLSPILHFEPFKEILRMEGRTWLEDIMSSDCVSVPEDAPAVQVAKEMIKSHVRQVFVVCGTRLVGVITIQDFINKVLRD